MDFSQIESALALATTAIGATGKAATTAETLKRIFSSGKTADDGEATKLLNNLAAELTAANMMNVQLSEALKSLSQQLKRDDEFEKERERYALTETHQGDLVYKLKKEMAHGQPIHFVCPVCLNRDRLISFIRGQGDFKICQAYGEHTYRFSDTPLRQPRHEVGDW